MPRYQVEKQNAEEDVWVVHQDDLTKVQAEAKRETLAEIYTKQNWRVRPHGSLKEPDPGPDPEPDPRENLDPDPAQEPDPDEEIAEPI